MPPDERDNVAVDLAAAAMKRKLAQKREEGRGGWHKQFDPSTRTDCYAETLAWSLIEHMEKGDSVDVLNFAMFLHYREDGAAAMREVGREIRRCSDAAGTLRRIAEAYPVIFIDGEEIDLRGHRSTEGDPDALAAKREQLTRAQADLKREELRRHTHAGPDEEGDTEPPTDGSGVPNIDPPRGDSDPIDDLTFVVKETVDCLKGVARNAGYSASVDALEIVIRPNLDRLRARRQGSGS